MVHTIKKIRPNKTLNEDLFTSIIHYLDIKHYIKCQQLSKRYLRSIYDSPTLPKEIVLQSETLNLKKLFNILGKYKNINRISSQRKDGTRLVSVTDKKYYN